MVPVAACPCPNTQALPPCSDIITSPTSEVRRSGLRAVVQGRPCVCVSLSRVRRMASPSPRPMPTLPALRLVCPALSVCTRSQEVTCVRQQAARQEEGSRAYQRPPLGWCPEPFPKSSFLSHVSSAGAGTASRAYREQMLRHRGWRCPRPQLLVAGREAYPARLQLLPGRRPTRLPHPRPGTRV